MNIRKTPRAHTCQGVLLCALLAAAGAAPPATAQDAARDLNVFAYVHDDVADADETLLDRHFTAWVAEMRRVLPERTVRVHLRRRVPGVTDAWYGQPSALNQWRAALRNRGKADGDASPDAADRFNLLLVNGAWVLPGASGATVSEGSRYGMASVTSNPWVPAHELGHMMGARHEFATRREVGFLRVCASIMWETAEDFEPCGDYSIRNTEAIRAQRGFWDQ